MINSRVVGYDGKTLTKLENPCYTCTRNFQRNCIVTKIFLQHGINMHIVDSYPPSRTIIIKSKMEKKNSRKNSCFYETIFNKCGDADLTTSMNKHVDPDLKLYRNILVMINSNKNQDEGKVNGTLARFKVICLKDGACLREKRWNGKVVNTGSVDDVECILCKHWEVKREENGEMTPTKRFRLLSDKDTVGINLSLHRKPLLFVNIKLQNLEYK